MADNEEGEQNASRGTEWEVVSLSASAYAAAPGPKEVELKDDDSGNVYQEDDAAEISRALFMSGHFVFPPSQHENLPLEPDDSEIHKKQGDEFPGVQFFDEKGCTLSIHGTDFEDGTTLQGLNLIEKEQSIYNEVTYGSLHCETGLGSTAYGENMAIPGLNEQGLDFSPDIPLSPVPAKEQKHDECDLPCGAWWKRRAASLYAHAKEANTFWSIFIAAAVMGLVVLGQQWQQERWQALQLKWQISINEERRGRMLGPIYRLKDVIVGGHRHGSLIRGSSSSEA
ncbi:ATG8-interacting protein 1 isoform X2 [Juglans microcarpa x Juglans regia]|uniref:ATG8-interacting protein 1 isoform X2 n=1 Tax=Juglans microcarpa x Juglans regia TaxID=2249226 RepID=UPI001B7E0063|nr:ATG8-interacting protein 1 isoform X2 [Juglans microcarpa x Juglans regia]